MSKDFPKIIPAMQDFSHRPDGPAVKNQKAPMSDEYSQEWFVYGVDLTKEYNLV